jgi:hypothetical protein
MLQKLLVPFYTLPLFELSQDGERVQVTQKLCWRSIKVLSRTMGERVPGYTLPTSLNRVDLVDEYFQQLLMGTTIDRSHQIVEDSIWHLYDCLIAPTLSNQVSSIWINFIHHQGTWILKDIWSKIPPSQRTINRFDLLVDAIVNCSLSPASFYLPQSPARSGFQVERSNPSDLQRALAAWTYGKLKNHLQSYLRDVSGGIKYLGFNDLTIVARESWKVIHEALKLDSSGSNHQSDELLCKVFKSYLKQQGLRPIELTDSEWQKIDRYYRQRLDNTLDLPPPNRCLDIEQRLMAIGKLVRQYRNPRELSIDRPIDPARTDSATIEQFIADDNSDSTSLPSRMKSDRTIVMLTTQYIDRLKSKDREILELYYRDRLTHQEIGASIQRHYTISIKKVKKMQIGLIDFFRSSQFNRSGYTEPIGQLEIELAITLLRWHYQPKSSN